MTTQEIQKFLNSQGYKGANGQPLTVDGISGTNTKFAIKAYQQTNGLTVDGIAGPITQGKMQSGSSTNNSNNSNGSSTGSPTTPTPLSSSGSEDYSRSGDTPYSFYGNENKRNTSAEQQSLTEEQGIANVSQGAGILSSSIVSSITSDPSIVAFYVNALTYGGYTVGDVLNDMKRRELINTGGTNANTLKGLAIIDPEQTKSTYTATAVGQKSVTDAASLIPTFNFQGLLNPDILKYGSNIPDDLFKTLVPILDPSSQEFKDAVAKVKATYFDLATTALQATTEQDKAVADYNLDQFKQQLETKYGITLSDDATKAWGQIQTIEDTMNTRNIAGSGIQNEAIDDTLKTTRLADQRQRDAKLTDKQQTEAAYYRASASSAEIANLTPQQRQEYGLTPSADVVQQYSVENLKAKNPSWTDAMIQAAHNSVIDENGNYRSALYSNYYTSKSNTEQTNQTTAENAVTTNALNKEATAYKDYDSKTAPLGQIAKQSSTDAPSSTASTTPTTPTNTPQVDTNPADQFDIYTGKPNPYYKAPAPAKVDTNPADQFDIYTGKPNPYYKVPTQNTVTTPTTTPKTTTPTNTNSYVPAPSTYKISYGDTLSGIAAKNNTTAAALAKLNNITDPNKIQVGQTIKFS